MYRQVSDIRRILVGNYIAYHSDVVEASPVGAAPTTTSFLDLIPCVNGLGKDNCKMRRESFKFWGSVRLILDILRYSQLGEIKLFIIGLNNCKTKECLGHHLASIKCSNVLGSRNENHIHEGGY